MGMLNCSEVSKALADELANGPITIGAMIKKLRSLKAKTSSYGGDGDEGTLAMAIEHTLWFWEGKGLVGAFDNGDAKKANLLADFAESRVLGFHADGHEWSAATSKLWNTIEYKLHPHHGVKKLPKRLPALEAVDL